MPADWAHLTVEAQQRDESSTWSFFRRMLRLRREVGDEVSERVIAMTSAKGTFAFRRDALVCVVNCGTSDAELPVEAGELLLSSGTDPVAGRIAPDTAAWFRAAP